MADTDKTTLVRLYEAAAVIALITLVLAWALLA